MIERTTTFGNSVERTLTFEGKTLKVQPVVQRTYLQVETLIREFWRKQYMKMAEETTNKTIRDALIRDAIMVVSKPSFAESEEYKILFENKTVVVFWIRVLVEGMSDADDKRMEKFLVECGMEFSVLLEGMQKVWKTVNDELGSDPDPKVLEAKLAELGLV